MTLTILKLDYKQIKEETIKQTEEFLLNGNWSAIQMILKSSPKQITELEIIPLFQKKVMDEEIVITPYFFEKNDNKYLANPIEQILNIISENPTLFSNNFKEFLLEKILPDSEALSGNAQVKINNALGDFLLKTRGESLIDYPRLFENLVSKYPKEISAFFPKIFELKWWDLAFRLFNNVPELINQYPEYLKTTIENISLNIYQFRNIKKILEGINIGLSKTIENDLKIKFQDFLKEFNSLSREELTFEWLKEKQVSFSTGILFYNDEELKKIIKKFLEFGIRWDHTDHISSLLNQFLYYLQYNGKSYLLREFLQDYKDLGYNLIREYIKYETLDDELIKELDVSIFDIVDQDPKVNAKFIDSLYGEKVVEAFKHHLENYMNRAQIFSVFFKAKPELGKEFTKVIENYYENINLGEPPTDDHRHEYSSVLFGSFGSYSTRFSLKFFIRKIKEYLSNARNREYFNPWSMDLLNHFDKMDKELQQDIVNLLIERKRYISIGFSLERTPKKFSDFIHQFLDMKSNNESEIRSIIEIFKVILRNFINDRIIFEKLKEMLFLIPNTYDKGLFLSFLGEKEKAVECFVGAFNEEVSISQKIFILTDYILEAIDIGASNLPIINLKALEASIDELNVEFEYYNLIKESTKKFPFKFHFLKARFLLFMGINYMNIDDYELSSQKLSESELIFTDLLKSKNIPDYNKDIIRVYRDISSILSTLIKRIENLKHEKKISELNQEISQELKAVVFNPTSEDIKTNRIKNSLETLLFNDNGELNQIKFELPANFCPLPPPIESISIKFIGSADEIYTWNRNLEIISNFEPLKLSKNYRQLEIIQKFVEKEKIFRYIIDFEDINLFNVVKCESIYELGRNLFKIDIMSNGFDGERNIKFCLKQDDICVVGIDLELPVKHLEIIDSITEYDLIRRTNALLDEKARLVWIDLYEFLDDLQLSHFDDEILFSETKFNKRLRKILSSKYKNVELDKIISGRIHVDVSVDDKIAIEVKRLKSNTKKDEVFGQLFNDLRIGSYKFGIAFGIDETNSKKFREFNRHQHEHEINIVYIIK